MLHEGDNDRLRLILYAPKSKFENDTIDDYKAGLRMSIHEEDDIPAQQASQPGPSKKRKGGGGGGLGFMSSQRVKTPKTRSLGGGWFLDFDSITSVDPYQTAAADLEAMYNMVVQIAAGQIGKAANATRSISFNYGSYSLRLWSVDPISWTWVVDFAEEMLHNVSNQSAGLFQGEAYSYYREIAAVAAALTIV